MYVHYVFFNRFFNTEHHSKVILQLMYRRVSYYKVIYLFMHTLRVIALVLFFTLVTYKEDEVLPASIRSSGSNRKVCRSLLDDGMRPKDDT